MFLTNKYTVMYQSIITKAQQAKRKKGDVYYERHHIIPKCMGGVDTVLLTAREHFVCHWLLTKMVDGSLKYKMQKAFGRFLTSTRLQQRIYTSAQYEVARKHARECAKHNIIPDSTGRKHSEETRLKMSQSKIGKVQSEETKAKISKKMAGVAKSEETKRNMSAAQKLVDRSGPSPFKGKTHSEEAKSIIKAKRAQQVFTEESRLKRSLTMTGRKVTEEQKEKTRQSVQAYWNKKRGIVT